MLAVHAALGAGPHCPDSAAPGSVPSPLKLLADAPLVSGAAVLRAAAGMAAACVEAKRGGIACASHLQGQFSCPPMPCVWGAALSVAHAGSGQN